MELKLVTFLAILAPANAQFHLTNALNLQSQALVAEQQAVEAAAEAEESVMDSVVEAMVEVEKEKELEEAKEKGEAFAPDGTPIPENQNNGVRPLDPRTPTTFGNPFARVNDVEETVVASVLSAGLSDEELALIEAMKSADFNVSDIVYDDVHNTMIYVHVPPRNMCGVSEAHATDWCGPTCDTSNEYCLVGHVDGVLNFMNYFDSTTNKYINWGNCYPDASCQQLDKHELISDPNDECKTRKITNPCPNPCDCFRRDSKSAECHDTCAKTDSMSVITCQIKRKEGTRRRERKIARELGLSSACAFNVFYEHPLMANEVLESESLPGLFGTF